MTCLNQGAAICNTRFPGVTDDGGSEGPPEVGGTPTKNPHDPSACPKPPTKSKVMAYSSMGLDPGNPANWKKYGLTPGKPIDGWPGEHHFDACQKNFRAWRDAQVMKAIKAGAMTIEGDNSDEPGGNMDCMADQINHECDLLRAAGRPCTLKNNSEILGKIKETPKVWILETKDRGEISKFVSAGKSKGILEADMFFVHYGAPSDELCKLAPKAHFTFSPSLQLSASSQKPCPSAKKSPPITMPSPSPEPEAPSSCAKKEKPPEDKDGDSPPPSPPPAEASIPSAPPSPQDSTSLVLPVVGNGSSAQRSPGNAEYPTKRPTTPVSAKKGSFPVPASTITREGDNIPESSGNRGFTGGTNEFSSSSSLQGEGFEQVKLRSAWPASVAASFTGFASPGANDEVRGASAKRSVVNPSEKTNVSSAQANEILTPFGDKGLGAPKLNVSGSDVGGALRSLENDFKIQDAVREPAATHRAIDEDVAPRFTLFERVHAAHERNLQSGSLTAR